MKKLPIGISEFPELREKECVYVDKTKHIYSLLTDNTRSFLSRPRRFGKSLLVSTLEAALQGRRELFEGLWIAGSDYSWKPMGVIRLDFSEISIESAEAFKRSLLISLRDIAGLYDIEIDKDLSVNDALKQLIHSLCGRNRKSHFTSVAILIDEYDHPILHTLHNPNLAKEIRDILKSFSCVIKARAKFVKFVFVVGVSAFSKSGLSSGLNNLDNLTMNEKFFDVCGYTDKEVDFYFEEYAQEWSRVRKISLGDVKKTLKSWYNGYCFKENTSTIYSPFSLSCSLNVLEIKNFWFESATPQFLIDELCKAERKQECDLLNLDELVGTESLLQTFEIESIPLTALLFQMGYLTIKSYDAETRFYKLKYPNEEVKTSLHIHLLAALTKSSLSFMNTVIEKLLSSLIAENIEEFIACLTVVFDNIPYQLHAQKEQFYHAILQALFIASGMKSYAEFSTSKGRVDIVLELQNIVYVIEVKLNIGPEVGLKQIETQRYYEPFLYLGKPIRALAISFHRKLSDQNGKSHFSITYSTKKI